MAITTKTRKEMRNKTSGISFRLYIGGAVLYLFIKWILTALAEILYTNAENCI
jgi:hypothetical protein